MAESPQPGAADYAGQVREYLAYCEDARAQVEARGGRRRSDVSPECRWRRQDDSAWERPGQRQTLSGERSAS